WLFQFAILETRAFEYDVVGLPFTRLAAGIHERRPLTIKCGCLAVGIGLVLKAIEHLDFVFSTVEEDTAVTAALISSLRRIRRGPFHVQLHIGPEAVLRH